MITARKKPGPHPEKPLDAMIKLRIDQDTIEKLDYCKDKLNTSRSDILRKGVHKIYEDIREK